MYAATSMTPLKETLIMGPTCGVGKEDFSPVEE